MYRTTVPESNCAMSGDGKNLACNFISNFAYLSISTDYGQTFSPTTVQLQPLYAFNTLIYGGFTQWIFTDYVSYEVFKSVCSVGSFSSNNTCIYCAAGTYSSELSAISCTACDAGKYSDSGQSSCIPCAAGKYSSTNQTSACTSCASGTCSSSGQTSCVPCAAGKYSSSNLTACLSCPAGYYSSTTGTSSCSPCINSYSPSSGSAACLSCPHTYMIAPPGDILVSILHKFLIFNLGATDASYCSNPYSTLVISVICAVITPLLLLVYFFNSRWQFVSSVRRQNLSKVTEVLSVFSSCFKDLGTPNYNYSSYFNTNLL